MKISALRAIDRWLGVPLCAALTAHRRVFGRGDLDGPIRRILFVKLAEQGSTVLAAPAIAHAVARVGRDNVYFVAFEENRFVLDAMAVIPPENVLTLDARSLLTAARSFALLLRRFRALRIDAAIDLEFFARSSAIVAYLSGARARVGLHGHAGEAPYRGDLFTHRVGFNPHVHTAQMFLLSCVALDHPAGRFPAFDAPLPDVQVRPPEYRPTATDREATLALLRARLHVTDVPPLALLNANCSDMLPLRRWSEQRYVELARRLLAARTDLAVVFTGAPDEAGAVERLVAEVGSPRCVSLAGQTTFAGLLTLYTLARVLVTNDSGPAHFAALTPTAVVTLFGPETPALFAARTDRSTILWAGLACSPCVNALNNRVSRCRDNVCMQRITVDDVLAAALAAYDRTGH